MKAIFVILFGSLWLLSGGSTATASTQNSDFSAFIVGGQEASSHHPPFFARLILHRTGSSQFINLCGGSIINDRFIMTAAHCVEPDTFTGDWTIDDLRVLVKNPTMNNVFGDEFKDVRAITIHPRYNKAQLWLNDIALLELSYPITDNVQSITLPKILAIMPSNRSYRFLGLASLQPMPRQGQIIYAGQKFSLSLTHNV